VVCATIKLLEERGKKDVPKATVYTTIRKNGRNNAEIEAALLDVIAAEMNARAESDNRRRALATA